MCGSCIITYNWGGRRLVSTKRTHTHTHTHTYTYNLTRFPVLVVLENNGLSKAAVCMQKFHVATLKGKVLSTNATKQGEWSYSFTHS